MHTDSCTFLLESVLYNQTRWLHIRNPHWLAHVDQPSLHQHASHTLIQPMKICIRTHAVGPPHPMMNKGMSVVFLGWTAQELAYYHLFTKRNH